MARPSNATLRKLSDSDQTIDGPANDIRGRVVKDKNGKAIGNVHDLLIDDAEDKVRFLIVDHGGFLGFGETRSFIPVDAITQITDEDVSIDQSGEHVAEAWKLVANTPSFARVSRCGVLISPPKQPRSE